MKLLQYSNLDGSIEYLVPTSEPITLELIKDNARPGCSLDSVFDLIPDLRDGRNIGELREGAEYSRK